MSSVCVVQSEFNQRRNSDYFIALGLKRPHQKSVLFLDCTSKHIYKTGSELNKKLGADSLSIAYELIIATSEIIVGPSCI